MVTKASLSSFSVCELVSYQQAMWGPKRINLTSQKPWKQEENIVRYFNWSDKENQPITLYSVKLSLQVKEKYRVLQPNKNGGTLWPRDLQEMLGEVLQSAGKWYWSEIQIYIMKRRTLERNKWRQNFKKCLFYSEVILHNSLVKI
jgi:hypothetical protein